MTKRSALCLLLCVLLTIIPFSGCDGEKSSKKSVARDTPTTQANKTTQVAPTAQADKTTQVAPTTQTNEATQDTSTAQADKTTQDTPTTTKEQTTKDNNTVTQDNPTSPTDQLVQATPTTSAEQATPSEPTSPLQINEAADDTLLWSKYTVTNSGLSFHYPEGWRVESNESIVSIEDTKTEEQMLMVAIPFDRNKDPATLASDFITLLQQNNPNVQASNWRTVSNGEQVVFDLFDKVGDTSYKGLGIVIKDSNHALWFSYTAPASIYSTDRSFALLQGFMESLSSSSEPNEPNIKYDLGISDRIDANSKGFLFVLEFALGAPFTNNQEQVIMNEFLSYFSSLTEEELSQYDDFPLYVDAIFSMNKENLEELRKSLEYMIWEWIEESPESNEIVRIVQAQLQSRGKEVIAGDPPLTEMSLTAYSEIIAYSTLLHQNPHAKPEELSNDSVEEIKEHVMDTWENFTVEERQQIATSPGLWFCLRTLLDKGSESEQENIRNTLIQITNDIHSTTKNNESATANLAKNFAIHNSTMAIQQMTFNHYMWTHGFNYSTSGNMW